MAKKTLTFYIRADISDVTFHAYYSNYLTQIQGFEYNNIV